MRQLDERTGEAQLHEITMQRDAFGATKHIGEIGWRRTNGEGDVGEPHGAREVRLEVLLRLSDQSPRRSAPP